MLSRPLQQSSIRTRTGSAVRAAIALVAAVATPLILVFGIAFVLLPGVPLKAGSSAFWSVLLLAGVVASALVCFLPRLRLAGVLAIGAASGLLFFVAFAVFINLFPAAGDSI
jgi:hypothetical protein